MRSPFRVATVATALLATLLFAPAAGAAVKVNAALLRTGDALQLEVRVTSTRAFTAATKPKSVKVGSLALKRSASSRKAVTFRSSPQRGAAATKLEQMAGKRAAIRVTTRGGTKTLHSAVKPAPAAPAPTAPTGPGATGTPTAPAAATTRNDAAGQAALAGDLLLEWASFGNVSAEYRRLWFMADGTFRLNVVDWMQQTGEKCRQTVTGTWAFKEGYTSDANGGLVLVKVGITYPGGGGDEVLTFANADRNAVYVGGSNPVRYERNPQINQSCG